MQTQARLNPQMLICTCQVCGEKWKLTEGDYCLRCNSKEAVSIAPEAKNYGVFTSLKKGQFYPTLIKSFESREAAQKWADASKIPLANVMVITEKDLDRFPNV